MLKTLKATFPRDPDLPDRTAELVWLTHVLRGRLYDNLTHAFHTEKNEAGEYVPLRDRRPSVRYKLCSLVVDDSVSLLFSESHFPEIEHEDKETKEFLARLCKELALNMVMIDAATRGSVGSVALFLRVIEQRVFLEALDTAYLTPTWRPTAPDTLAGVTERYKVKGRVLKAMGYLADKDEEDYWFQRDWTEAQEIIYYPLSVADAKAGMQPQVDPGRVTTHSLGFVPLVWVKNLPGGDEIDGLPTFPNEAIETGIEIDYQLSQAGRGLKYSSDPTLLVKEPANGESGKMVKGGGNAIVVGKDGDAKMLEINGTAAEAVLAYVDKLRTLALESMHGNRSDADKLSAAQSGRALELMHQALIWLADRLRISYGEGALLSLLNMIVQASEKLGGLRFKDGTKFVLKADKPLSLRWPAWFTPTTQDMLQTAQTLNTLVKGGLMSRETAVKVLAAQYDIEDTKAELALIQAEMVARDEAAKKTISIAE
jgi:hypothetical protein